MPRPSSDASAKRRASSSRASAASNSQRSRVVRSAPVAWRQRGVRRHHHLRRAVARQRVGESVGGHALEQEFAGGEVDRRSQRRLRTTATIQLLRAPREPALLQHRARRHRLDHFAAHDALGELRVFHLLADRDAMPRADQLPQVLGRRLHRHAGERHAVAPGGERDAEHPRAQLGVVEEHLVEVAHPEEQDRVAMPRLDLAVLQHQRRVVGGLAHGATT